MTDRTTLCAPVGRTAELGIIDEVVAAAAAGRPGVVVVRGDAGVGKTTLLREAARRNDVDVVWATGDEHEIALDHGLSAQLLAGSAATTDGPLRGLGLPGGPTADPFTIGAALIDHLGSLAAREPVAVLVDDAHLVDPPSLQALTFAMRRMRADGVAVVVACRDAEPEGRLPPGLERLADATGGSIQLSGLDAPAITELASAAFGRSVPASAGRRLRDHTDGNPLHTLALLDDLAFDSVVASRPLPAPSSYATLVISRLASCSPEAESLTLALAVLGVRAPLAQVAAVAGVAPSLAALDELDGRDLATIDDEPTGPELAFVHRLVRASVYDDMSRARRVALHAAAGALLPGDEGLHHRLSAATGPDPVLAADARSAAEAALARGAGMAASSLLLGVARVAPTAGEQEESVLRAVGALMDAGERAGDWERRVADLAPSARRSYVLGRIALAGGHVEQGGELLEDAWQRLGAAGRSGDGSSDLEAPVAETLALVAVDQRQVRDAERWARQALAAPGGAAAASLAHALVLDGRAGEVDAELAPVLSGRSGMAGLAGPEAEVVADALLGRAVGRLVANDLAGAATDFAEVERASATRPGGQLAGNLRTYLAELHYRAGRWSAAADVAEVAASVAEDADRPWLAAGPRCIAASVSAGRGDGARAAAHVARAAEGARASGMRMPWLWAEIAAIRVGEAAGDHAAVVAAGDRLVADGWTELPFGFLSWRAPYAEALIAAGRIDDAGRAVPPVADVLDHPVLRRDAAAASEVGRAAAAVAAARGGAAAAGALLDDLLALDETAARPYPRGRLELAAGAHWRRAGRRRQAAALLERAAGRFQRLGAHPWIERCERELVACGLRPAARRPGTRVELTAQERVVANLAGSGRTNREVSQELVISVKTVEHHLSRIYAKLEVRSRTELAALLATTPVT